MARFLIKHISALLSVLALLMSAQVASAQCVTDEGTVEELTAVVEHDEGRFGVYKTGKIGFFDLHIVRIRDIDGRKVKTVNLRTTMGIYGTAFDGDRSCRFAWQTKQLMDIAGNELIDSRSLDPSVLAMFKGIISDAF